MRRFILTLVVALCGLYVFAQDVDVTAILKRATADMLANEALKNGKVTTEKTYDAAYEACVKSQKVLVVWHGYVDVSLIKASPQLIHYYAKADDVLKSRYEGDSVSIIAPVSNVPMRIGCLTREGVSLEELKKYFDYKAPLEEVRQNVIQSSPILAVPQVPRVIRSGNC